MPKSSFSDISTGAIYGISVLVFRIDFLFNSMDE